MTPDSHEQHADLPTLTESPAQSFMPVIPLQHQTVLPGMSILLPAHFDSGIRAGAHRDSRAVAILSEQMRKSAAERCVVIACLVKRIAPLHDGAPRELVHIKGVSRVECKFHHDEFTGDWWAELIGTDSVTRPPEASVHARLRKELLSQLRNRCPEFSQKEMIGLLEAELSLSQLCDLAAPALGLSSTEMQTVLCEKQVDARCQYVLERARRSPPRALDVSTAFGRN